MVFPGADAAISASSSTALDSRMVTWAREEGEERRGKREGGKEEGAKGNQQMKKAKSGRGNKTIPFSDSVHHNPMRLVLAHNVIQTLFSYPVESQINIYLQSYSEEAADGIPSPRCSLIRSGFALLQAAPARNRHTGE